ncbi:MAG: TetR/AcrR family transcriptional regulator [Pseudomonadota bacterium]
MVDKAVLFAADPPPAQAEAQPGKAKVRRLDWLSAALDRLVSDGVDSVKVLSLSARLGVSRSSFYWYFKSRQDLLDALLAHWQNTNTAGLVGQAEQPAATITEAVCNVFHCVFDPALFDTALDYAVRDWARRSARVRAIVEASDRSRLAALVAMFARFGYRDDEAVTRARVLYYMQIGYSDADLREPLEARLRLLPGYLYCFTGRHGQPDELAAFHAFANRVARGEGQ